MREPFREFNPQKSQEDEEQNKSMLEKAHEMVAKALGGGSRGKLLLWVLDGADITTGASD